MVDATVIRDALGHQSHLIMYCWRGYGCKANVQMDHEGQHALRIGGCPTLRKLIEASSSFLDNCSQCVGLEAILLELEDLVTEGFAEQYVIDKETAQEASKGKTAKIIFEQIEKIGMERIVKVSDNFLQVKCGVIVEANVTNPSDIKILGDEPMPYLLEWFHQLTSPPKDASEAVSLVEQRVIHYQSFFKHLQEIDERLVVIKEESQQRTILVNPSNETATVLLDPNTNQLYINDQEQLGWSESQTPFEILNAHFPNIAIRPDRLHDYECSICGLVLLQNMDTVCPCKIQCAASGCGAIFHEACLREWINLAGSVRRHGRLLSACPQCETANAIELILLEY